MFSISIFFSYFLFSIQFDDDDDEMLIYISHKYMCEHLDVIEWS